MIRILGPIAILVSIALISYRIGYEVALYHGSVEQLADAARLRFLTFAGYDPAREP